jgi:hypothetical protein
MYGPHKMSSLPDSEGKSRVPSPVDLGYQEWIELGHATELLASRTVPSPSRHLSLGESDLVVGAIGGEFFTHLEDLYPYVYDDIKLDRQDEKCGVDGTALLETLRCCRTVDLVALLACYVRWLNADDSSDSDLYEASGFSNLLLPSQPVPGEVRQIGEPEDTLNRIDLDANEGVLTGEALVAFLEHRDPRVRQHAIHRLGSDVGLDAFEEPLGKPTDTGFRE